MEEFRTILLGQWLKIFTKHKILHVNLNTNKVLRCSLILEKYGPDIEYIQGKKI